MHLSSRPRSAPMRAMFALLLVLACALSPAACAGRPWPSASLVELELVDRDSGQVLDSYRHAGQRWVAGEPGHRYAVRLHNRSGQRVLAVLSVDGINAIDGRSAEPGQAGYVLGPWQALEINGWRKSLDAVAQFVFDDPAASYAARTGRPANIGVIGVAVFRERGTHPFPSAPISQARRAADAGQAAEAPAAAAGDAARSERRAGGFAEPSPSPSLGTGHGAIEGSHAYYTGFEREAAPAQLSELRYDTRAALLARGIAVEPPDYHGAYLQARERPRAFPGAFVPDP